MTATQFTPLASTIGGVLIGIAAVMLMLFNGRIAGISGIVGRLLPPYRNNDVVSAAAFILGLMGAPLCYTLATSTPVMQTVSGNVPLMAIAGLLVGTAIFMATAFVTVFVARLRSLFRARVRSASSAL